MNNQDVDADEAGTLQEDFKSKKFQVRINAYEKLKNWSDPTFTKEDFIKELPNLSKEKHWKVLVELIDIIE